jgi:hypothetical protein
MTTPATVPRDSLTDSAFLLSDLAYATIAPNVLVLETTEGEQAMGVHINGVEVSAPRIPTSMPSHASASLSQQQQQQHQDEAAVDNMLVAMFPNPPPQSLTTTSLMNVDDVGHNNEYVLSTGGQVATGHQQSANEPRSQPATPDNGEGPSGSGVQGVRRTMRVKLDLKVTTSTKRID